MRKFRCWRSRKSESSVDSFTWKPKETAKFLSVDEIVRRKRETAKRTLVEKESVEDAYTHFKTTIYEGVAMCNETLERFVFFEPIQKFLKLQNNLRRCLGCSKGPVSNSAKEAYADVLLSRSTFARKSLEQLLALESKLQTEPSTGKNVGSMLRILAQQILRELNLEAKTSSLEDRIKHFPQLAVRSADGAGRPERLKTVTADAFCKLSMDTNEMGDYSLESAFRVFLAMRAAVSSFELLRKEDWLERGLADAHATFGELAFIIMEEVHTAQSYFKETVDRGIESFNLFFASSEAWNSGKLAALEQEARDTFSASTLEYLTAWTEYVEANKRCINKSTSNTAQKYHTLAGKMLADQKTYITVASTCWATLRNVCPEAFHDWSPVLRASAEISLLSLRSCEVNPPFLPSFTGVMSLFVDRTLEQYQNISVADQDLLRCEFNGEKCLVKRFTLSQRVQYKSLFNELAMLETLDRYMLLDISAVFIDNGDCYLHAAHGGQSWLSFINKEEEEFALTGSQAVVMANQMCRVLHGMHDAGVTHGDLRVDNWAVNTCGVPKLHGFASAQFLRGKDNIDVIGLGKCLVLLRDRCKGSLNVSLLARFSLFIDEVVSGRYTANQAFAKSEELVGALSQEHSVMADERARMRESKRQKRAALEELNIAAGEAEVDLGKVMKRVEIVKQEEMVLREKHRRVVRDQTVLRREMQFDSSAPPAYWENRSDEHGKLHIVPIPRRSKEFQVFRHLLVPEDPKSLNRGRDVVEAGNYSYLDLCGVWRVENVGLWRFFASERQNMRHMMKERAVKCPPLELREHLRRTQACLPGYASMHKDINEVYLLHGTRAENVITILKNGLNERFTSMALFGKGTYFAEDAGKTDQYVRSDPTLGSVPELHSRLFPENGAYLFPKYPLRAYYLLVCRQIMGYPVRVKLVNMRKRTLENLDNPGGPVFATQDQRELAPIPDLDSPPIYYHSLVAERGGAIVRFREFVQFRSARIYPEYLICYTRK